MSDAWVWPVGRRRRWWRPGVDPVVDPRAAADRVRARLFTVDPPEKSAPEVEQRVGELEKQMKEATRRREFEQAAELRDEIRPLRQL